MPRPKCCRRVTEAPACLIFKPAGIPSRFLEEVVLTLDQFEAIRLADYEGLYHEEAARRMSVSRQTFGRILDGARASVARILVEGLSLRMEGGEVIVAEERWFQCRECRHSWSVAPGTGRPSECPACRGTGLCRTEPGVETAGEPDGPCRRKSRQSGVQKTPPTPESHTIKER